MLTRRTFFLAAIISLASLPQAFGQPSPMPPANVAVTLTISGEILKPTQGQQAIFDGTTLAKLPQIEVRTHTRWTEGVVTFRGPLLRDVLKLAGAQGQHLTAIALNDYKVEIPWQDIEQYPVILALSANGKPLARRDKGPIWLMYPIDDYKKLQNAETHSKLIWQLKTIHVE